MHYAYMKQGFDLRETKALPRMRRSKVTRVLLAYFTVTAIAAIGTAFQLLADSPS